MPAQRKASKKADSSKYAPSSWGREFMCDLEVPSGQMCLVRRPGPTGLIKAGLLDSLDSLTGLVQIEHIDRVEPSADGEKRRAELADMSALSQDPERLRRAMELVEKVIMYVVVEPKILPAPEPDPAGREPDRLPGVVYIDQVGIEDQMFIFNFVLGGTEDLAAFRDRLQSNVAGMEAIQNLSV